MSMNDKNIDEVTKGQHPIFILFGYYLQFSYAWSKVILFSFLTYVITISLTWLPDIDQIFISILHHRSIITHSILIPFLFTFVFVGRLSWMPSILYNAVGIHLAADLLSPSVGFGAIWFPEPFKFSLGELSKVWILVNIVSAFFLAYRNFPKRYISSLFFGTLIASVMYGLQNENSLVSSLVISIFFVSVSIWQKYRLKISFIPSEEISNINVQFSELSEERNAYQRYRKSLSVSKRMSEVLLLPFRFIQFLSYLVKTVIGHPKKSALIAVIVLAIVSITYFSGTNVAVEGVKNGVYVLHSSGGWILQEGGKYVAGTLTDIRP
jgi:hypothetical protein